MLEAEVELEFKFSFTKSENIMNLLFEGHHGEGGSIGHKLYH